MRICEAIVKNTEKISSTFQFLAQIKNDDAKLVFINYVSPHFGSGGSGFVAIPPVDQTILVVQPEDSMDWYYIGSYLVPPITLAPDADAPKEAVKEAPCDSIDPTIYKASGVPKKIVMKDELGNMVSLNHSMGKEYMKSGVEIKSSTGKHLTFEDTYNVSRISLQDRKENGIVITSNDNNVDAGGTLKSFAVMTQEHRAGSGDFIIHLQDGRDVKIVNTSTQINSSVIDPLGVQAGNVNVESLNGGVNIYSRANWDGVPGSPGTGKISLECIHTLNPAAAQLIQLLTSTPNSSIALISAGNISILGALGVNITSPVSVNIESTGKINLNAQVGIDIKSNGPINIDGATVNLNSGLAVPPPVIPPIPSPPNYPLGTLNLI